jgi:hypothetical protein
MAFLMFITLFSPSEFAYTIFCRVMNQYMNVNVEISRGSLYTSDIQIVNVYLILSLLKYGLHTP